MTPLIIPKIEDVKTNYRPIKDFVMVAPIEADTMYKGIVHLPDNTLRRFVTNEGHIIAKGPKVPDEFVIGQRVLWDEHAEIEFELDDVDADNKANVFIIPQGAIMLVVPQMTGTDGVKSRVSATEVRSALTNSVAG
jgi:co-chaperonin GroES (HSP10)